jgi:hypothetical protein
MAFVFADDIMFAPDGFTNPMANMPMLPKDCLANTAQPLNPHDFGIFL